MHRTRALSAALLFTCCAGVAFADDIYEVTADTSSISGMTGALDFKFNPGLLLTQAASLEIFNFSSDGSLDVSPATVGDVSGLLPSIVSFDNGMASNDYFQGFTFGSDISFDVRLFGPALTSPDGVSTSGSTFAFTMFSDAAGTMPALTTNTSDGFAVTADVNLDGTTALTNFSSQTTVVAHTTEVAPEPNSFVLAGIMMALSLLLKMYRRA
jgi:hypothetical protein